MKITINYGNSASINTGVPYEALKPFYNVSIEKEYPDDASKVEAMREMIQEVKPEIDRLIFKDMKELQNIRKGPEKQSQCGCLPTWDPMEKKYRHSEACLSGTARIK